jgi:uncharacterized repeat protein (TIGR04076 family)
MLKNFSAKAHATKKHKLLRASDEGNDRWFRLKNYRLTGKIVEVKRECTASHRVGEEFDLTLFSENGTKTNRTPHVCPFLYDSVFPYLTVLQFDGTFPWEKDRDKFLASCPDKNKVVIEIRRTKSK